MNKIDLRQAKPGDKLVTKNGNTMLYIGYNPEARYPHTVMYANNASGSRIDDGRLFYNSHFDEDEDIVEIVPFTRTRFDLLATMALTKDDLMSFLFEHGWSMEEFSQELDKSVEAGVAHTEDALQGVD